jgi:hypothetical protein
MQEVGQESPVLLALVQKTLWWLSSGLVDNRETIGWNKQTADEASLAKDN